MSVMMSWAILITILITIREIARKIKKERKLKKEKNYSFSLKNMARPIKHNAEYIELWNPKNLTKNKLLTIITKKAHKKYPKNTKSP